MALCFLAEKRLAPRIGQTLRSCAFVEGNWLVYGEERFGDQLILPGIDPDPSRTITREQYDAAHAATGIDEAVLANYAYIARNVPRSMRRESLSCEHHRTVAKLEEPDQQRWLNQAEKAELTSRRLRA